VVDGDAVRTYDLPFDCGVEQPGSPSGS